jgi:hypothetical protein
MGQHGGDEGQDTATADIVTEQACPPPMEVYAPIGADDLAEVTCPPEFFPVGGCTSDEQCKKETDGARHCHEASGCCLECWNDADCPEGFECSQKRRCVLSL